VELATESKRLALERLARWKKQGPAQFAIEALGATPEPWQIEAGRELAERRRLSVRSGHGVGKSAFMAWVILWFMSTHFPCKVPCTAPTSHQLSDILWAELAKWHRALKERMPALGNEFEWTSEKFVLKSHPQESFAVARTSRPENPEALQGFHSTNIIFLIDEASGVPDEVYQVAEGALSSEGAFVVMAGNPTRTQGYFYDSHHKMRASWATLHVNGEDVTRVSKQFIADMAKKYGTESSIYKIRVKGEFASALDGVIGLDIIEPAKTRQVRTFGPVRWGVDVARFGDDLTALCKRHGNTLPEKIKTWGGKDTMQVAGLIKAEYDRMQAHERPEAICIDVIGLGAGVVDRCKELKLPVVGINVAESPAVAEQYARLRDELWFRARDWFHGRDVKMVDDEDLIGELTLPTFKVLSTGKKQVESKDEIKKRAASPDRADAFCLTFANGGAARSSQPLKYDNSGII
jgi:phage terminase large subunit